MKRKQLIALGIAAVVFALTFNTAFLDIHIDKPFLQLGSFLVLLVGSLAAWAVGNTEEEEKPTH